MDSNFLSDIDISRFNETEYQSIRVVKAPKHFNMLGYDLNKNQVSMNKTFTLLEDLFEENGKCVLALFKQTPFLIAEDIFPMLLKLRYAGRKMEVHQQVNQMLKCLRFLGFIKKYEYHIKGTTRHAYINVSADFDMYLRGIKINNQFGYFYENDLWADKSIHNFNRLMILKWDMLSRIYYSFVVMKNINTILSNINGLPILIFEIDGKQYGLVATLPFKDVTTDDDISNFRDENNLLAWEMKFNMPILVAYFANLNTIIEFNAQKLNQSRAIPYTVLNSMNAEQLASDFDYQQWCNEMATERYYKAHPVKNLWRTFSDKL